MARKVKPVNRLKRQKKSIPQDYASGTTFLTSNMKPTNGKKTSIPKMRLTEQEVFFQKFYTIIDNNDQSLSVNPFQCGECGKSFPEHNKLILHTRIHTRKKRSLCNCCEKPVCQKRSSKLPIRKNAKKILPCLDCGKCFTTKSKLIVHSSTHSNEKPFVCRECGRSYKYQCSLKLHSRKHSQGAIPPRENYQSFFPDESFLKLYIRSDTSKKPFHCLYCGKRFNTKSTLTSHMRKHHRKATEKLQQCSFCNLDFPCEIILKKHISSHHISGFESTPSESQECEDSLEDKELLSELNIVTHIPEMPSQCEHCQKVFRKKSSLIKHIRSHNSGTSCESQQCEDSLEEKEILSELNIDTHIPETPSQCEHCQKVFTNESSLKEHLSKGNCNLPLECQNCKKSFENVNLLQEHASTFADESLYHCHLCDTTLSFKKSFVWHIHNHASEKTD